MSLDTWNRLYEEHEAWAETLAQDMGAAIAAQSGIPSQKRVDLAQSGRVGLWKAIRKWKRRSCLRTLAHKYIRGELTAEFRAAYPWLRLARNAKRCAGPGQNSLRRPGMH